MSDSLRQGGGTCDLCDLPTPEEPVTGDGVEGVFCCRGCLEVHRTLGDVETHETGGDRSEPVEGETAFVGVDGMHCSTCELYIESKAESADGVVDAEASYASDMVKMVYDPDETERGSLVELIDGMGYTAYDPNESREGGLSEMLTVVRLLAGGWFGMMVMFWYLVFLYPDYLGIESLLWGEPPVFLDSFTSYYLVLGTSVVLFFTGFPILRSAYVSLRSGTPNMDLLVAVAAVNAYVYSIGVLLTGGNEIYFDITVAVVMVVTVGNYYEKSVKERASGLVSDLAEERVDEARLRENGHETVVPLDELETGDEVVVKAGERVPVDGRVVEGSAAVDESLVTGESVPLTKREGDKVIGGTVVTDNALVVEVPEEKVSTFDRLVTLLWDVQSSKPGAQRAADRLAGVFVPLVLGVAVVAFAVNLVLGAPFGDSLLTGLAVLVVSCPCALGLATPLAVASGTREALENGIVVTDPTVFEEAHDCDVVAFDKTGTLSTGEMEVLETGDEEALKRAAAVEKNSNHPIAEAVSARFPSVERAEGFEQHDRGVSGTVGDTRVVVGSDALFEEKGWDVPDGIRERIEGAYADGCIPVVVGWDGRARSVAVVGDRPREGWEDVVEELAEEREVVVITGDDERASRRYTDNEDVDEVFAGVPPEAKAEVVERLNTRGSVAMVGDGTNDAPALAAADLGIALGSGTAVASDAADVVVTERLGDVTKVFELTKGTKTRIRQNLGWAFVYNAIAVPVAVAGFISPVVAAAAMATSSILVVTNSSRSVVSDG